MGSDKPKQDVANGGREDQLFSPNGTMDLPADDQGEEPVDELKYSEGGTLLEDMSDMEQAAQGNGDPAERHSRDTGEIQVALDDPESQEAADEEVRKSTVRNAIIRQLDKLEKEPQDREAISALRAHLTNEPDAFDGIENLVIDKVKMYKPDDQFPTAEEVEDMLNVLQGRISLEDAEDHEIEEKRAVGVEPPAAADIVEPTRVAGGVSEGPLSRPIETFGKGSEGETRMVPAVDAPAEELEGRVNGLEERAAEQGEMQEQLEAEMRALNAQQNPPARKLSDDKLKAVHSKFAKFLKGYRQNKIAVHLQPYLGEFLQAVFKILTDAGVFRLFRLTEYLHKATETEWNGMVIAQYEECTLTLRSDLLRFSFKDGRNDFRLSFPEEMKKEGKAFAEPKQKRQMQKLFEAIKAHLPIIRGMHRNPKKLAEFYTDHNKPETELLEEFFSPVFDLFFKAAVAVKDLSKAEDDPELAAFWEEVLQLTEVLPDEVWHGLEVMEIADDLRLFLKKDLLLSVNGELHRANLDTEEGKDELRDVLRPHAAKIIDRLPLDAITFVSMVIAKNS